MGAEPSTEISSLYLPRTVHLETIGELFTGEQEAAAAGSGLLVADDLVLTDSHVVPDFGNRYRSTHLDVRVGSRSASSRTGTVIARDADRDLALVEITPAVSPTPYCPVAALGAASLTPQGASIYILSYPLDEDASVLPGIIRNKASDRRWLTNAPLNPNDSGGPAFTSEGYLVGLVVGGITEWTNLDGGRTPVFGMNYIIPAANISGAGMDAQISRHDGSSCWKFLSSLSGLGPVALANLNRISTTAMSVSAISMSTGVVGASAGRGLVGFGQSPPPSPPRLSTRYGIEQMQAIHNLLPGGTKKTYGPYNYAASKDYRVVSCTFLPVSSNHASDVNCAVSQDGNSVSFTYTLESGPAFDRWRGWLNGTVVLRQEKIP